MYQGRNLKCFVLDFSLFFCYNVYRDKERDDKMQTGIYLLSSCNAHANYIKCGKTINLQQRLRNYDTHNPIYELIDFMPVKQNLLSNFEKQVQYELKKLSVEITSTEWCRVSTKTLKEIKQMKLGDLLHMSTNEKYIGDIINLPKNPDEHEPYKTGAIARCIIYMYNLHIPNVDNFAKEVRIWLQSAQVPAHIKKIYTNAVIRRNKRWHDAHPGEEPGENGYRGWHVQFTEEEFRAIIQVVPSLRSQVTKRINTICFEKSENAPKIEIPTATIQKEATFIPQQKSEHTLIELQNIITTLKNFPDLEIKYIIDNLKKV